MAQMQIYEGTAEEIAEQIRLGGLTGRLRAIVGPADAGGSDEDEEAGDTLLVRMKGLAGCCDFGDANLSDKQPFEVVP